MVRDLRPFLRDIVVQFDADEDDKDDKDGAGDGGDDESGDGASGTGTDATKPSGKDDIKDPEKKRLSDEAAAHRVRAKAEKDRADAAEAELRKLTDKDKSELEKAQRDLKETTARAEKAEAQVSDMTLRLSFYESGAAALFKDHEDARKLLDFSTLKPGDDGTYDKKEVKALADALLKAKPYLAASDGSDNGSNSTNNQSGGDPQNGRKGKTPDNAALVKKFPALASRG
jgi:hypothetical protein